MTASPQTDVLAPQAIPASSDAADAAPPRRGSDYSELSRQVRAAGLLNRRPGRYTARIALNAALLGAGIAAFVWLGDSWSQLLVAAYLGFVFTQLGFLGHDAGHWQIFGSRRRNDLFGLVLANLAIGLSYDWWIGKHNRHHSNPNHEERDPDLGVGAIIWTPGQARERRGVRRFMARRQAYLFFPMLTLEALHLHYASARSLVGGRGKNRIVEAILLAVHLVGYVSAVFLVMSPWHALAFIAVHQAVFGLYLGCAFAPNHKGMPILSEEDELDYLRKQVLTARNVRGGWLTEFALGGLNYQIEHHLFPSMPSHSLRRCQPFVRAFCQKLDLPYCEAGAFRSYGEVLKYLHAVGRPLRSTT
ncbi:MAG: acyl-CoA desaturase [Mycobacteriales bacterium]